MSDREAGIAALGRVASFLRSLHDTHHDHRAVAEAEADLAAVRDAIPAEPLDVERLARTGVKVWGWDLHRARQYAKDFAREYAAASPAAPEPTESDPVETFSHPYRAPVVIDGHQYLHTSDCEWPASPAAPETPRYLPGTDIEIKVDPTMTPGEWRLENPAAPETRKPRVVITESEPDFAVAEKVYDDEEPG